MDLLALSRSYPGGGDIVSAHPCLQLGVVVPSDTFASSAVVQRPPAAG